MTRRERVLSAVGPRRAVATLGALYVAAALAWLLADGGGDSAVGDLILVALIAGPGLVVLAVGYRLPAFDVRPEFHPTVAEGALGGFGVMVALLGFYSLQPGEGIEDLSTVLILTALATVAGLAAGVHNAQSKSRARELEETIEKLEAANEHLDRHRRYTDDTLDAVDEVFYVVDESGTVRRWNESLSQVTGYSHEEIAEMSPTDFFEDEDRAAAAAAIREGFEEGSVNVELDLRTRDGESIPFEFVGSTLSDPSGDTVLAGIARDVTERVERERRLEASNERLEQFAYAASHDLQEPLRMVSSYLQLVERRYADELDEDGREFVEFAVDGADRMRDMIEGLLQYSRVDARGDALETVDLDDVLAAVCDDLSVRIEETDAEIAVDPLPRVRGDAEQLRQVFQNLLENAIEYSGDDPPRIHVSAERDGDRWLLSVRDEGIGIDPDEQERVFEVFRSLHAPGEHSGTGIGLALCERIVERHGGDIWVDSEPGDGSTFYFTLPADEGPQ